MSDFDHRSKQKLEELKNLEYVSEENFSNVEEFTEHIRADTNISNQRIYKYLCTFKVLFKEYLDFNIKEASKKDWRKAAGEINNSDKSPHTTRDYIVTAKKYYNTVYEEETERPKRVKKILNASFMSTNSPQGRIREYEPLTPDQVMAMVQEASNPRNKLLPLFMFETGARVGEILGLEEAKGIRLKDIELKEKYADVDIETLKKKDSMGDYPVRTLPISRSVDLLQKWLEQHPRKDEKDAQLFCNLRAGKGTEAGDPMAYRNLNKTLDKLAEAADIDQRVSPHIFRHSSATHKGVEWNAERLMWWHGWDQMETAQNYVQQNEKRLKNSYLEEEGIRDTEEEASDNYSLKECGRCGEEWPPTVNFCGTCSLALDEDTAVDAKDAQEAKDKAVKEGLKSGKNRLLERVKELEEKI